MRNQIRRANEKPGFEPPRSTCVRRSGGFRALGQGLRNRGHDVLDVEGLAQNVIHLAQAGRLLCRYSMPAHGVSGDYYDIFDLDKNKIAMIVCDVAGKGVPAAMVMVMIRSIVRLISSPKRDVATTVKWINLG